MQIAVGEKTTLQQPFAVMGDKGGRYGNSAACGNHTGWKWPMGEEQRDAEKLRACQRGKKPGDNLPRRI